MTSFFPIPLACQHQAQACAESGLKVLCWAAWLGRRPVKMLKVSPLKTAPRKLHRLVWAEFFLRKKLPATKKYCPVEARPSALHEERAVLVAVRPLMS